MGKKIEGVEIFSAGTWNGDKYDASDLDEMVRAFDETKGSVRPYLKLGHDKKQVLLQKDGLPAAGWVDRVYRKGLKLLADFSDIPDKIYDLIEKKAYRNVSSEIFWDISIGEKKYKRMLAAVALLGADTPGVMNLDDILAMYGIKGFTRPEGSPTIRVYEFLEDDGMPTEKEIELEAARVKAEAETAKAQKAAADAQAEVAKYKLQAETAEAQKKETAVENAALDLTNKKLISPAMKPYVVALLGDEKKEYTVEKKSLSRAEVVEELLKLASENAKINFTETTTDSKKEGEGKKSKADELNEKVEAYAEKNKVSYSAAYRAVVKEEGADYQELASGSKDEGDDE